MPDPELNRHLAVMRRNKWFAQLPSEFAQALLGMARVRQLDTGQALFLRNDPPCGLYALVRGALRISGQSAIAEDAREAVLIVLTPASWFGEIGVFDRAPRAHHAHAIEPCTLLQIPQAELLQWLDAHPAYWRDLALLMADKLRLALINIEEQTLLSTRQRLVRRLLLMAQGYGQGSGGVPGWHRSLQVTQDELARMIGTSRQTTNEILNDLKAQGLVSVQRGRINIPDLAALQRAGEG
jgi:CRP/FNR family cyclic AMP-dependent transcriptional regulator